MLAHRTVIAATATSVRAAPQTLQHALVVRYLTPRRHRRVGVRHRAHQATALAAARQVVAVARHRRAIVVARAHRPAVAAHQVRHHAQAPLRARSVAAHLVAAVADRTI